MILSAGMMLEYVGMNTEGQALEMPWPRFIAGRIC
jgi:hypothetical protein